MFTTRPEPTVMGGGYLPLIPRELLERLDFVVAALAEALGHSPDHVSRWIGRADRRKSEGAACRDAVAELDRAVARTSYDFRIQWDGVNAIPTFGRNGIALPVPAHCGLGLFIVRRW